MSAIEEARPSEKMASVLTLLGNDKAINILLVESTPGRRRYSQLKWGVQEVQWILRKEKISFLFTLVEIECPVDNPGDSVRQSGSGVLGNSWPTDPLHLDCLKY